MENNVNTAIRDVAGRIRALRESCEVTEEEMAACTGTTLTAYQALEAGESDFTFTFIYKCAQRLGTDPTDILKGSSPTLSEYYVNRAGDGLPIVRRKGFHYNNLAPLFKDKIAEPFYVTAKYSEEEQTAKIRTSCHAGQEFDLILKGTLKVEVDGKTEILHAGDSIYYNSGLPHGMIAVDEDCEFLALVMNHGDGAYTMTTEESNSTAFETAGLHALPKDPVIAPFIQCTENDQGLLQNIQFSNLEQYNFAYDTVDALGKKCPDKVAMVHLDHHKNERRFTFGDMSRLSNQAANYFRSVGIRQGDRVMLVLKRHWQFWAAILGLHKLGAVAIPATHMLVEHDFVYRYDAAGVSAIVCTADGDTHLHAQTASKKSKEPVKLIMAGGTAEGWLDFDGGIQNAPETMERVPDACGSKPMIMFFTSGTTGYPKIAAHSFLYAIGHYITARYWHNIDPKGIHFTISDTGWGKALWGKLYGQWLCEGAIFTYDFDKFDAHDILPLFKQYNITTFCAPPTMFRFFIKEDLNKYDLSSLSYVTTAGEALNPEVFYQFKAATGLTIMEGFGQTETTLSIGNLVGSTPKPGSMGKPSPMYQLEILRPDGTRCPAGETGEICINTKEATPPGLFLEYYRDDEHTSEAWHDGYYHTGDTAWMDEEGYIWYVGRTDDVIKSSGYRIGPFEIESVIMELPYVLECAITPVPDPVRGQIVKATIVLVKDKEGSDALKKEVQDYVKEHTAPYKYPRIVEFVKELPKTISGKIRRVEIRAKDAEEQ
ncbi:MAG: AMP-binding protein [Clostridiales bacterium]|jgi:acetyl-CoA synthetase|nr:AMP-binding protein [Clostridiales bacterium]